MNLDYEETHKPSASSKTYGCQLFCLVPPGNYNLVVPIRIPYHVCVLLNYMLNITPNLRNLTLLHSQWSKLNSVLAILSATGITYGEGEEEKY